MAEIARTPYDGYMMYKVYHKNENRFFAVLVSPTHRTTIAYAKYVLEVSLGRKLKPGYQAHHRDENKSNDDVSNLEEKESVAHRVHHDADRTRKYVRTDCPVCFNEFICEYRQSHWGKKVGTRTACSDVCRTKTSKFDGEQVIKEVLWLKKNERPDSAL